MESRRRAVPGWVMAWVVVTLAMVSLANGPVSAQEVIFMKSLEEAEKAVEEARRGEAEEYAPNDYLLALLYLTQAKDEAMAFRAGDKKDPHLFSLRKSGEAVNLLAERARHQARVARTRATEVKLDREITAIKAQIVESFNTDVSRHYTPDREDLLGELSVKELIRKDARRAREQVELELKQLTLEVEPRPTAR